MTERKAVPALREFQSLSHLERRCTFQRILVNTLVARSIPLQTRYLPYRPSRTDLEFN